MTSVCQLYIVTAATLEVYYVPAVYRRKLTCCLRANCCAWNYIPVEIQSEIVFLLYALYPFYVFPLFMNLL